MYNNVYVYNGDKKIFDFRGWVVVPQGTKITAVYVKKSWFSNVVDVTIHYGADQIVSITGPCTVVVEMGDDVHKD